MKHTWLNPEQLRAVNTRCSVVLAMLLTLAPVSAIAEQSGGEDPNVHWQTGIARFQQGDFATALESFQRFIDATSNPAVRFNIAVCHFNLQHFVDARNQFALYLAETDPAHVTAERRAQVQERLEEIGLRVGLIDVRVEQTGAAVSIGGNEIGTSPLATPWAVQPGSHEVRVTLAEYEDFSSNVSVIGNSSRTVEVSLSPVQQPVEPGSVEPVPGTEPDPGSGDEPVPAREGITRAWFAITTSLALSLGIGGIITGAMANGREDDFAEQYDLCRGGTDQAASDACARGQELADEGQSLALATNVLLGTAGAFALTAIVLAIFTSWSSGESEELSVSFGFSPLAGTSSDRASGFLLDAAVRF